MRAAPAGRGARAPVAGALAALIVAPPLAACAPDPAAAAGRLTDARTDAPIPHAELTLAAEGATCPPQTVKTDADGRFSAAGLCGGARWTVAPTDPGWYLPAPVAAGPDVALAAWRAPPSPGVYVLSGTTATLVPSHTVLDTVRVFDTTEEVRFPVEIPGAVPRLAPGDALLVADGLVPELAFAPLVPSPERRWFGDKDAPVPVDPWVYLGVRFTSDTAFERVSVALDAARVASPGGPRALRYVSADALPAGRHALPNADGTRAWILDFGAAPAEAPAGTAAP